MFRAGYVAILGRPNVGKSTLFNRLIGEKLAAVSPKPQTTRHRILGIKNRSDAQILFLDTPGLHKPHKSLNELMVEAARQTLSEADVVLLVVEANKEVNSEEEKLVESLSASGKPFVIAVNKIDCLRGTGGEGKRPGDPLGFRSLPLARTRCIVVCVSARTGEGLPQLEESIINRLPESPPLFPEDQLTDLPERFFTAETIREKVIELTHEEVPYSVAVLIEEFREPGEGDRKPVVRIKAAIVIERDSQKGILIGKGGKMIKEIGQLARKDLEARLGQQAYLELFVRVEKEWTKDPQKVKEFTSF